MVGMVGTLKCGNNFLRNKVAQELRARSTPNERIIFVIAVILGIIVPMATNYVIKAQYKLSVFVAVVVNGRIVRPYVGG